MTHRRRHRVPRTGADAPPARRAARCASSPSAPRAYVVEAGEVLFTAGEAADGGYVVQQRLVQPADRTAAAKPRSSPGRARCSAKRRCSRRPSGRRPPQRAKPRPCCAFRARCSCKCSKAIPDAAQRLRDLHRVARRPMGARDRERPRGAGARRLPRRNRLDRSSIPAVLDFEADQPRQWPQLTLRSSP